MRRGTVRCLTSRFTGGGRKVPNSRAGAAASPPPEWRSFPPFASPKMRLEMEKGTGRSQWAPQPFSSQPLPVFFCQIGLGRFRLQTRMCSHRYPKRSSENEQMARADTKGHFVTLRNVERTCYKREGWGAFHFGTDSRLIPLHCKRLRTCCARPS